MKYTVDQPPETRYCTRWAVVTCDTVFYALVPEDVCVTDSTMCDRTSLVAQLKYKRRQLSIDREPRGASDLDHLPIPDFA